ncbi:MAG: hypothetical protein V3U60_16250 [Gammaproteobacteria bacterium]
MPATLASEPIHVNVIREFLEGTRTAQQIGTLAAGLAGDHVALSATLTSGNAFLEGGVHCIKIGSELMLARLSGATLTISPHTRAYMGSTLAAHSSSTAVYRAQLNDLVASRVYTNTLHESFKNTVPGLLIKTGGGAGPSQGSPLYRMRVNVSCYGGQDRHARMVDNSAAMVLRALQERVEDIGGLSNIGSTESGVLVSCYEDTPAQAIRETVIEPDWPFWVAFLSCEIRGH